jgi:hypothetical protein
MTVKCTGCNQDFEIPVTDQQLYAWKSGILIQKAMPGLNDDQRELLISQTCIECWDNLFEA